MGEIYDVLYEFYEKIQEDTKPKGVYRAYYKGWKEVSALEGNSDLSLNKYRIIKEICHVWGYMSK